jgi:hypothetical protein
MSNERSKEFVLGGKTWRMDKVNPLDGSNLLRMFSAAGNVADPKQFLANMAVDQFQYVQRVLLSNVYKIDIVNDQKIPTPLILPDGSLGINEGDAGSVFAVTVIALMFNMKSFFEGNTLEEFNSIVEEFNVSKQ